MRAAIARLHDAAKAGCLNALSRDHRAKALAIVADFNAGKITLDAAGAAVAELLSNSEVDAIGAQRRALVDGFHAAMAAARGETPDPNLSRMPPIPIGREHAGSFFVETLGDPGVVFAQETPLPLPSASPN
jgi:hypothetical protein